MVIVQICVGSSCHLKGSPELVECLQRAIEKYGLEDEVILNGSFCIGQCNRVGVTIQVNDTVHVGITPGNFEAFFKEHILSLVEKERN